jgi:hypothetical protein
MLEGALLLVFGAVVGKQCGVVGVGGRGWINGVHRFFLILDPNNSFAFQHRSFFVRNWHEP